MKRIYIILTLVAGFVGVESSSFAVGTFPSSVGGQYCCNDTSCTHCATGGTCCGSSIGVQLNCSVGSVPTPGSPPVCKSSGKVTIPGGTS